MHVLFVYIRCLVIYFSSTMCPEKLKQNEKKKVVSVRGHDNRVLFTPVPCRGRFFIHVIQNVIPVSDIHWEILTSFV